MRGRFKECRERLPAKIAAAMLLLWVAASAGSGQIVQKDRGRKMIWLPGYEILADTAGILLAVTRFDPADFLPFAVADLQQLPDALLPYFGGGRSGLPLFLFLPAEKIAGLQNALMAYPGYWDGKGSFRNPFWLHAALGDALILRFRISNSSGGPVGVYVRDFRLVACGVLLKQQSSDSLFQMCVQFYREMGLSLDAMDKALLKGRIRSMFPAELFLGPGQTVIFWGYWQEIPARCEAFSLDAEIIRASPPPALRIRKSFHLHRYPPP